VKADPLALIGDVIAGRYLARETGQPLLLRRRAARDRADAGGPGGRAGRWPDLGARLAVVADENTAEVLGRRVRQALPGAELILLEHPKADEATADLLQERARHADGLVAVGSGTINDLCKYVTHRTGRACAVFATAPSMDGYVTSTVSITRDGFKLSLPAHAPRGVFFDLTVLAAAPARSIRAGLGDTICRSTAQVDWLLSHLLLDTFYADTPYDLMRADEPVLYGQAHRLLEGDQDAMLALTRLLVLSGLGVLVTGTSHCGSMAEHQVSHYVDMFARPHPGTLHGEQVGLATWSVARLQARMLANEEPPVLRPLRADPADFGRRYGSSAPSCLAAFAKKPLDEAGTAALNERLARDWPAIRRRLLAVMMPLDEMEGVIRAAGLATRPGELDIPPVFYREAVGHAHEIRDRYSVLDLAAQAGALEGFAAGEG
jgi:glycerol-1-phosphate dehydrogenase [NAD(P)+]